MDRDIHPLYGTNLASWYMQPASVVTGERNVPLESNYKQESNSGAWSFKTDTSVFSMDSRSRWGIEG